MDVWKQIGLAILIILASIGALVVFLFVACIATIGVAAVGGAR
jgi:hypothetical protein